MEDVRIGELRAEEEVEEIGDGERRRGVGHLDVIAEDLVVWGELNAVDGEEGTDTFLVKERNRKEGVGGAVDANKDLPITLVEGLGIEDVLLLEREVGVGLWERDVSKSEI